MKLLPVKVLGCHCECNVSITGDIDSRAVGVGAGCGHQLHGAQLTITLACREDVNTKVPHIQNLGVNVSPFISSSIVLDPFSPDWFLTRQV